MNARYTLVAAALASCTATGAGAADYSIGLVGEVPVICRATVDTSATVQVDQGASFGVLSEFCNSARGYRVFVDPSAELAGATLFVDGQAIVLSGEGDTLISASPTAARASHSLALSTPQGATGGTLAFRIEPR